MEKCKLPQSFKDTFRNPGREYRGTPFWSWNTKLNPDCLEKQIEQFHQMGMGGFYMHTRVGLDTEYMGQEYIECVEKAVKIAKEKNLYSCLYDEDRWPSGYGGGKVTSHREYRSRNILITPYRKGTKTYDSRSFDSMASASPQGNGVFLAAYYVKLNEDGTLASYERCSESTVPKEKSRIWYVYLEIAHDSPWFNNQSYVDTLNPEAIRCFLDVTHEKYKKAVGNEFGKNIPSVFTDEPQFGRKKYLGTADSTEEVMLPFTDDFTESYQKAYGENFLDFVPELLWELPKGAFSRHRYQYHDHVTERFAKAYSEQIGTWCRENGLLLAGHMMEEPTLQSQTQALGEVMRSLKGFTLPGIDMLCDAREYTTAKQAESICHQYGRAGVASELYGVTNWDFDFRRHKLQGDWQAALGITHRVHHLNWMSMGGEAKRDYPAAIGFQSPWYKEYEVIESHFARINTAMRRGKPIVKIGVIHPVESMWLLFGPSQQTNEKKQELDKRFQDVTEWLLFNNLDFDYISESLLPEQWDGQHVGEMNYDVILIPGCLTLRKTTVQLLEEMKAAGKKIIFMGSAPKYVDAVPDCTALQLAENCCQIEFAQAQMLKELEAYRNVEIRFFGEKHLKKPNHKKNWNGERTGKYIYQMRQDGEACWLFIANGRSVANPDLVLPDDVKIELAGKWKVTEFDTMTGKIHDINAQILNDRTVLYRRLYEYDSLLLYLTPRTVSGLNGIQSEAPDFGETSLWQQSGNSETWEKKDLHQAGVHISREEPNVLVLDMPEYDFDGSGYQGPEEILRADNLLRAKLDLPLRRAALAQPWTESCEDTPHKIRLKYKITAHAEIGHPMFAMECMEAAQIFMDGEKVEKNKSACKKPYFVDPCIQTTVLPAIPEGEHELLLVIDFTGKVNLEACYLLGDFSVNVSGSSAVLDSEKQRYTWSSLTEQGMPFYGGNAVYSTKLNLEPGIYRLEVSKYKAPLLNVTVDGETVGNIITAPYYTEFQIKESGAHFVEIRSFGSRVNTFGAIHDCDENEIYFDPNAWRTEDESWAYEYQLKQTGILKAPVLWKKVDETK